MKQIRIVLHIFFVGIFAFFAFSYFNNLRISDIGKTEATSEIRQSGYNFINPLLECEIEGEASLKKYIPFEKSLKKRIQEEVLSQNSDFQTSVYFRNLNNGPWIGIKEKEFFSPASLLKVPIMIAYFKEAENRPEILKKEIVYPEEQELSFKQTIISGERLELGKTYDIEYLIKKMIVDSDNEAMNLLVNNLPSDKLSQVYSDLGVAEPSGEKVDNFMTVKEYASFFRILYNSAYLDKKWSEKALEILSQSKYLDGIMAGVDKRVKVAHKFGERELEDGSRQLHDCGIVYYEKYPYLLCVMTRGNDFNKLSSIISKVSKITFEEISKDFPMEK